MSVYTKVSFDELAAWLLRYALGPLVELAPIVSGIENTNYFVTTETERLVLTLYERLPAEDLPFYLNLMAHLAQHGVPAPISACSTASPPAWSCGWTARRSCLPLRRIARR